FLPGSNDGTRCCCGVVEIVFIAVFIDNGTTGVGAHVANAKLES
ncbi:hypothetical protein A2U01_0049256, partial [Trifolium medium]|nr:hypothetical protein [Trifolium medium]